MSPHGSTRVRLRGVELHALIGVGAQLGTPHNREMAVRHAHGMGWSAIAGLSATLRSAHAGSLCVAISLMCLVCGVYGFRVRCR